MNSPRSVWHVFQVFNRLSLQGFGGVLPVAQRELVEREGWLNQEEFLELLAFCQIMPGPNIINLALILGWRFQKAKGAFAALLGMLLLPGVIVLALTGLYRQFAQVPWVAGALQGMGMVAAGLLLATALKLGRSLHGNLLGWQLTWALVLITLVAIAWLHWPLLWVVVGLGMVACSLAWRKLKRVSEGAQ